MTVCAVGGVVHTQQMVSIKDFVSAERRLPCILVTQEIFTFKVQQTSS